MSLPLDCPSAAGCAPVSYSNYVLELGGAMGIRTPDLLHAIGKFLGSNVSERLRGRQPGRAPRSAAAGKGRQRSCDTSGAVAAAGVPDTGSIARHLKARPPGRRSLPDIPADDLCGFGTREDATIMVIRRAVQERPVRFSVGQPRPRPRSKGALLPVPWADY